ncbi:uncharacterized protein GIQ15_03633 [Arthroderma uncinatum]|uniref:uncharacterized protein n=1 Tax=Arthroderma uncinatum TaxID=74035 RepID=UPI00144ACD1F|nr:uncharacterized protein GIQ15_03633 [Arthroderma uncinatum]KAF3484309.1 hypothetical protein GIQ15_03633 [Arthroderma uncinatum]
MGVTKFTIERGSGDFPTKNDKVRAKSSCYLYDDKNRADDFKGKEVILPGDSGFYEFCIGDGTIISGLDEGVSCMKLGELCDLIVSSDRAYGEMGFPGSIPPNSDILFLVRIESITRPDPERIYGCTFKDCIRLFGGDYQGRFWCGFCRKTCPVAEEGFEAMEKRHEHVGGHFKDGQSITEWVDAGGREPNWAGTPNRVLEVVGLPTPECAILQNGLISRARAISHTS